jgi:OmpA family
MAVSVKWAEGPLDKWLAGLGRPCQLLSGVFSARAVHRRLHSAGTKVQERQVVMVGHTGRTGLEEANYQLGQQRAVAVAHYLLDEHGLDPVLVRVISAGGKPQGFL